ncbi:Pericentrin [Varanus komodoensis]|nr:Pericentrin [Varanus komodoensis]
MERIKFAIPAYIINSLQESEGITRLKEKSVLQAADLKAAENDTRNTDRTVGKKSTMASSNLKMQKLYRKYLRAESFRKALVYQKKYLLLLLGGFQECEQATLSLIARMGIYPSPTSLNVSEARSQSFTRFRSAVRVVIAISRFSSASQALPKDPEHLLTEYIAYLEAIQQRLGILMPGFIDNFNNKKPLNVARTHLGSELRKPPATPSLIQAT